MKLRVDSVAVMESNACWFKQGLSAKLTNGCFFTRQSQRPTNNSPFLLQAFFSEVTLYHWLAFMGAIFSYPKPNTCKVGSYHDYDQYLHREGILGLFDRSEELQALLYMTVLNLALTTDCKA